MDLQPFLYRLQLTAAYEDPDHWQDQDWSVIEAHAAFMQSLGDSGRLLFAGRTQFEPGHAELLGIAVLMAEDLATAQAILSEDPAVKAGIQTGRVDPYRFAMLFPNNFPVSK